MTEPEIYRNWKNQRLLDSTPKPELFSILSLITRDCTRALHNWQTENKLTDWRWPRMTRVWILVLLLHSQSLKTPSDLIYSLANSRQEDCPTYSPKIVERITEDANARHKSWTRMPIIIPIWSYSLYGFSIYRIKIKKKNLIHILIRVLMMFKWDVKIFYTFWRALEV